jgi:hypothetical protein
MAPNLNLAISETTRDRKESKLVKPNQNKNLRLANVGSEPKDTVLIEAAPSGNRNKQVRTDHV